MATKVYMEALSPTMEEGRLVKWTKREGDAVKTGDTLAEVETDKAVMELVARADGHLIKVETAEGSTVPVGNVVAYIGTPGEKVDGGEPTPPGQQGAQSAVRSAREPAPAPEPSQPLAAAPPPSTFSPGAPMYATTLPTGTVLPSAVSTLIRWPSARATSSMTALSVSTSARVSPVFTASPSRFVHLTRRPSSIVGESASM